METNVIRERTCETSASNLVTKSNNNQTSAEFVNDVQKKVTDKCSHFSIRAYVAEIRRKDWKISWPFSSVGDGEEQKEQADMLPPLHIPEFRWWGCQNCLRSSGATDVAADIRVVSNSSEEKICEGRKAGVNASMDVIEYECCPMVYNNMKEKVADVLSNVREDVLIISRSLKNGAAREVDQTRPKPALSEEKDAQCLNEEIFNDDAETINLTSKVGALVELGKPNCGTSGVDEVGLGAQNPKCPSNSSTEICQMKTSISRVSEVAKMSEQKRDVMIYHEKLGQVNVENEDLDSLVSHCSNYFSLKYNENDENQEVDNLHIQRHRYEQGDSSRTLICSKPPKVRLLTDIMRKETQGASTIIPSSNGTTNSGNIVNSEVTRTKETDGLNFDTLFKSLVPVQENIGKDTVGKGKKRKMLQVEDYGPLQMRWSMSAFGNVQICKGDEENNCIKSAIAHSESINDAFAGVDLHSGLETQSNEYRPDGMVIYNKKEDSMHHCEDGKYCPKPSQESLSSGLQLMNRSVESKETGAGTLQFKMAQNIPDYKSTFCMNESNVPENVQETLIPLQKGMRREDLIRVSGTEPSQIGTAISSFGSALYALSGIGMHPDACRNKPTCRKAFVGGMQTNMALVEGESSRMYQDGAVRSTGIELVPGKTAQDTMLERALHTSLNYCMDTTKRNTKLSLQNNKTEVPQVEGGIANFMPHHEDVKKAELVTSEDVGIKPAVANSISLPCPHSPSGKVAHCGLKSIKSSLRKASTSTKLNDMSQVQERASPLEPKDCPIICNYRNNMDVQRHSEFLKNKSNDGADKVYELDDDIPMEIVELLAKNRHERRLIETEKANRNKYSMPETTKNVKTADTVELTGVLEDEMAEYLLEKDSRMQKSQSSNGGGCIFATDRSVEVRPVGETSFKCNSHNKEACKSIGSNVDHLEESHDTKGLLEFPISQGNHSHENEVAEAGAIRNFGFQRGRWNWDIPAQSCPNTCLQCCLKTSPKGSCPRQCRDAHHVCFMNMADGPSEIDYSQRFATLSRRQHRDFDLKMSKKMNADQPCACTQKKVGSCSKLVGTSDLCSNKSMSAMQLLRLMDSGISSSTSPNVDKNIEFSKKPSFPRNYYGKELSTLNDGIFKIREASKQSFPACLGKNHSIGESGKHFPSEEMVSHSSKSREKTVTKSSCLPMPASDFRLDGSASGSGSLGRNHKSFPINGLKKGFHSASNTMVLPLKSHLTEGSINNAEVNKKGETYWPEKGNCRTGICSVNRNPADFSIPASGNEFMREGADIKCRKKIAKRGRPRLKMMKLVALKEPAQN
ncbi:uncharacterized protein LOC132284039 [Cornus florida]|uniref:uncharacterized protein LOC132284039 n=1 Tax=Cornus florida TaxID=4283 RepID=UPI00289A50A4|nr:uncharacterized protein LOC132284039 [Cornus florida]